MWDRMILSIVISSMSYIIFFVDMKGKCFAAITKLAPPDAYAYEKEEEKKDTYTRDPSASAPPGKVSSKKEPAAAAIPHHACNKICKLFF